MKLKMKANHYVLNAACGCPKGTTNSCGILYRSGS